MKAKKTAPPRRKFSFAVDREEIEINSDWVEAVMASPAPVAVVPFPAPLEAPDSPDEPVFFAPASNTSTDADNAPAEPSVTVVENSAVAETAPVAETSAVAKNWPVVKSTSVGRSSAVAGSIPVAVSPTVAEDSIEEPGVQAVAEDTTVANGTTVAPFATDETFPQRVARPRPLRRITDGLTPGQYAVYSLMYEAGESAGGLARIYKGGYADLGRLTGLSKRGIQNIVGELQAKQVIGIHQQPGYHRTETTTYLLPDPDAVMQAWASRGWRNALGKSKTLVP